MDDLTFTKELANRIKRHSLRFSLILLSILLLVGIEISDYFSLPPARDWNATNLKEIQAGDSNNFSFAVFGDNKNSHSVFENLLAELDHDPGISFAMNIGDMVYDGEKEKYRYFLKQIRSHLHKPLLTALGNHELKENGRALYYEIFGPFYYSFQIGKTSFIVLDDADERGLDWWQKRWLEAELSRSQSSKHRLIFMHVPLYDPRGGTHHHCLPGEAADELAQLFRKYNVTHIFASHIHGYFQGQWNGIPYTITGGAGAELWGNDPNHFFFHYIGVQIHDEALQIEVKSLPSPAYESMARMVYFVWLYLYAFLRIHGIELALLLIIASLAAPAYRFAGWKLKVKP
jgi:serine/threonine-protein phosphatase CPPED1